MNLNDALNQIIDDGIEAARADYTRPDQTLHLEGSIAGFEECRGLNPERILDLLVRAGHDMTEKHRRRAADYWYWSCRWNEIGWVANVLSACMQAQGWRGIVPPTARGMIKAAEIMGVAEKSA